MQKYLLSLVLIFFSTLLIAAPITSSPKLVNESRQLLVVTTHDWDSNSGKLQLYERNNTLQGWQAVGGPIEVTVGKAGLAWDASLKNPPLGGPAKKEGDFKTPAGIFPATAVFGFAPAYVKNIKMPYIRIMPDTVCVNDPNSKFYNHIITGKKVKPDWQSAEQMHSIPQYMWGIELGYNNKKVVPNGGSCTFIHIGKASGQPTSGCVAMPEPKVEQLTTWLDAKRKPVIIILPKPAYKDLEKSWNLPV